MVEANDAEKREPHVPNKARVTEALFGVYARMAATLVALDPKTVNRHSYRPAYMAEAVARLLAGEPLNDELNTHLEAAQRLSFDFFNRVSAVVALSEQGGNVDRE